MLHLAATNVLRVLPFLHTHKQTHTNQSSVWCAISLLKLSLVFAFLRCSHCRVVHAQVFFSFISESQAARCGGATTREKLHKKKIALRHGPGKYDLKPAVPYDCEKNVSRFYYCSEIKRRPPPRAWKVRLEGEGGARCEPASRGFMVQRCSCKPRCIVSWCVAKSNK